MKRVIIGFGWLMAACAAVAGTGASNEFRVDTRRVKIARPTETIAYSSEWVPPVVPSISVGTDVLANGGFESCTISSGSYGYNKNGQATLVAWSGNESAGMTIGNNTWTSGTGLPKGSKAAYLQRAGSIWQDFTVPEAGIYKLSFYSAARPSYVGHYMSVAIDDGADVLSFTSDKATAQLRSTTVELTKGTHRLKFTGTDASKDQSTIIDDVSLVYQAPLPVITPVNRHAVVKAYPCLKEKPTYIAIDLSGGTDATHYPVEYFNEIPGGSWSDEYKTSKLVLRHIPAGSFIMGQRATDYPGAVNTNLHMVTLTRDFYMGVFEVTQRQWELVMGNRPSAFSNETCYATRPVESISWNTVRGTDGRDLWPFSTAVGETTFIGRLRLKTQLSGWDAPTCSQWEYACRAGTTTSLNSGKNFSSFKECPELHEVSRNCFNSGWTEKQRVWSTYFSLGDTSRGTAKVGSYEPNRWGLYDMHGNVWEKCLDHRLDVNVAVDPVGLDRSQECDSQVIKGGSFEQNGTVLSYCSGYWQNLGLSTITEYHNVGFRLCLQGGNLPDLKHPEVLVDTMAEGSCTWSSMTSGTRYLTHATMNGSTNEQLLSAWFEVGGPRLSLSANGELVPDVGVSVAGNEPGWSVYYTLDGTEPTTNSTAYAGAIALNETATIRAVAYNAQGVRSEEASATFTLHDALAVEDTKARQRYPWNGKVDIDCEITGDATKKYAVTFSVEDEIGHTNLTIKTVSLHCPPPPLTSTSRILPPGHYRFTWDAAADLPKGTRFGGVSVSIDAEPSPLADWKRVVTISTDGYAGNETLTDVPVLVRLSSAIEGFDYADFSAPDTGADMIFTDMEGTARYPYEIDEWHKDGESLVWVKLPELKKGTKFKLAYGGDVEKLNVEKLKGMEHRVWKEYAGVWHMNEDSGTAFDSTEHGLDALPSCGTNKLADVSQMVAYENGACGRARVNATAFVDKGNYLSVPSYDALALGASFVASGWFNGHAVPGCPRPLSRKAVYTSSNGWETQFDTNKADYGGARGGSSTIVKADIPSVENGWVCIAYAFAGNQVSIYTNGALSASGEITPATDNGLPLSFGNNSDGSEKSWHGQYDEIRLRGGSLSADRIKADYDMIAKRDFCTYGKVEAGPGAEPVPPSTTYRVRFNANGGSGTMADEVFEIGVAKALTANAFKKDGYAFQGWATSEGGAKVYSDKQSVSNLTMTPGATVNLYTVWKSLGGVQLWENGPYWAECNVGATKPEESGYYFWWGDTVGYKRNGSKWDAADGSKTGFSFNQENCPTEGMDNAQLRAAGYVDWNGQDGYYDGGNLVAAHDAATAHLGAPWRMPTADEISTLVYDCDWEWTKVNGVFGRKVKGRGTYASKQIFLPAAGYGRGSNIASSFLNNSKCGQYWSSTAAWDYEPGYSLHLFFDSFGINRAYDDSGRLAGGWDSDLRYGGCTIRPVR